MADVSFVHEVLPSQHSIRLLELRPGMEGDTITCSISVHLLQQAPAYDALSYTWGSSEDSTSIFINDEPLQVRVNAYNFLRRKRHSSESSLLWIDAICIDQSNLKERSEQVAIMHKIYELARTVIVWLGQADDTSGVAMTYASDVDPSKFIAEYTPYLFYGSSNDEIYWAKSYIFDAPSTFVEEKVLVNALAALFTRTWFSRVWITQEAAVNQNTVVFCGPDTATFDQLFAIAWLLSPRWTMLWPDWVTEDFLVVEPGLQACSRIQTHRIRNQQIREEANNQLAAPFHLLLGGSLHCQATDPRDKIYALRNLASDLLTDDWVPKPDYERSWEDLYTDVASRLFRRGNMDTFSYAGRVRQPQASALASWVPDWRGWSHLKFTTHGAWRAGALRPTTCVSRLLSKKQRRDIQRMLPPGQEASRVSLTVKCLMADEMSYLGGIAEDFKKYSDVARVHQVLHALDWAALSFIQDHVGPLYITGEAVEDAYAATLIAETTHEDRLATQDYCQMHKEWQAWLVASASGSPPTYHVAIENSEAFRKTQICVTGHGYLCLVPVMTVKTDCVAIIAGYRMPVVLRPVGQYYELIGDCYIHGMMESQAFSLIDDFALKLKEQKRSLESKTRRTEKQMQHDAIRGDPESGLEGYTRVYPTLGKRSVDLI